MKKTFWRFSMVLINQVIMKIPSNYIRLFLLKNLFHLKAGSGVKIAPKVKIISPWYITIGENSIINSSVLLDGRGKLNIGKNVDIAWFTKIVTYQHDYHSSEYSAFGIPVHIENNCCVAINSVILPGSVIPEGSVVGASSTVTSKLEKNYAIYAGTPARFLKDRNCKVKYVLKSRSITI